MANIFKIAYELVRGGETVTTSTLQDGDKVVAIVRSQAPDSPVEFEPIRVVLADLPNTVTRKDSPAVAMGISTKLGNGLIKFADAERPAEYARLAEQLVEGVLFPEVKREAGRRVGDVAEAVRNVLIASRDGDTEGVPSVDDLKAKLKAMDAEDYAKYSQDAGIKAEVARIQLARAEAAKAASTGDGEDGDDAGPDLSGLMG